MKPTKKAGSGGKRKRSKACALCQGFGRRLGFATGLHCIAELCGRCFGSGREPPKPKRESKRLVTQTLITRWGELLNPASVEGVELPWWMCEAEAV